MLMGAKKFAQQEWILVQTAKKFAQQAKKGRFWGVLCALGELFRAWALMKVIRANFVALVGLGRGRSERKIAPAGGAVECREIFFAPACAKVRFFASFE